MLSSYWVDLHVHTALSPCGELEMGAPEIVAAAREAGIDVIAVSDHNSADNCAAVMEAAGGKPVVFPAIEVQSAEDIHVVTIFPDIDSAREFHAWLWEAMAPIENDPDVFGYQVVIDSDNDIVRMEDILLVQGVGYEIDTIVARARERGAIVNLAHIDRPAFAYPAVLGPIPDGLPVDAFELSCRLDHIQAREWRERYPGRTFIRSSDSHQLGQISRANCTKMSLLSPDFDEIRLALSGRDGRRVFWPWG